MKIIELKNLSKNFTNPVLIDIDYVFKKNGSYLIMGENGSGKTTLIKLILGLLKPSKGIIFKKELNIAYVPDYLHFPEFLSIKDYLIILSKIYKSNYNLEEEIEYLLKEFKLNGSYKLNQLSKGMRQKVLLIQALINSSNILILDEPLNGLDKEMQDVFLNILKLLKGLKTLIIVSHNKEVFKNICDIYIEIKRGRLYEGIN